jgi:hypothetical protein
MNFLPLLCGVEMKLLREHQNLFLGLAFAGATIVAWKFAYTAYTRSLGTTQTGGKTHHFNLDHVAQRLAEDPGLMLEQWLGPQGAEITQRRRTDYRGRCAAALLSGFMTVFFLGMYLDELKSRKAPVLEPAG